MKSNLIFSAVLLAATSGTALAQSVIPLVTNTNPGEVTSGSNGYVGQILAGQTFYVGVPHAGGGSLPGPVDYFTLSTFLLSSGGPGTVSFSLYTATDTGAGLTDISPLSGVTAGTAAVAALVDDNPAAPGNTILAEVNAVLEHDDTPGDPFAAVTGGVLWLGITNTSGNTLTYYTGNPFGGGVPGPTYAFSAPLDTAATALNADSYIYNSDTSLAEAYQNVHPYVSVSAVTVPETDAALLTLAAGSLVLLRRRGAGRA